MHVVKMVVGMTETAGKAKDRTLRNNGIWDGGKEKVTPKKRCLQRESRIGRGDLGESSVLKTTEG